MPRTPPVMDEPFPLGMVEAITEILRTDYATPTGADVYPHVFESPMFFPLQRQRETAQMIALARSIDPAVIMEIGTDKGGGLYHWCKGLTPRRVVAAEIRGTPYSDVFEQAFPTIDFLWLPISSYEPPAPVEVELWLDRQDGADRIDVLFIDGAKAYFYQDFMTYMPMMRRGGIVFMHDVTDPAPSEAFSVASRDPRIAEAWVIHDITESHEAMEREARGLLVDTMYEGWLRYWKGASCGVGVLTLAP
jgi:predicted O-methyltransferase YrrM